MSDTTIIQLGALAPRGDSDGRHEQYTNSIGERLRRRYALFPPSSACLKADNVDEISALVLDPGSSTTRAGFAGEDVPKAVIPTHCGRTSTSGWVFGDNSIHTPLSKIQILNPMAPDGTVEDWEAATKLWEYAITSRLTNPRSRNPMSNGLNDHKETTAEDAQAMEIDEAKAETESNLLEDNPLLMTETGWNSGKNRERAIEVAIEEWGCPAFWLARNGVLSA